MESLTLSTISVSAPLANLDAGMRFRRVNVTEKKAANVHGCSRFSAAMRASDKLTDM